MIAVKNNYKQAERQLFELIDVDLWNHVHLKISHPIRQTVLNQLLKLTREHCWEMNQEEIGYK